MNFYNELSASKTCTKSYDEMDSSFNNDVESSQSISDSDFEMPPEFPPGATVGDLSSHLSRIVPDNAFLKTKVNGYSVLDGTCHTSSYVNTPVSDNPISQLHIYSGSLCDMPITSSNNDNLKQNLLNLTSVSPETKICSVNTDSSDLSRSPTCDNLQPKAAVDLKATSPLEVELAPCPGANGIERDPEYYSDSSDDDFANFQSSEAVNDSTVKLTHTKNPCDDFTDFSDFQNSSILPKTLSSTSTLVVGSFLTLFEMHNRSNCYCSLYFILEKYSSSHSNSSRISLSN